MHSTTACLLLPLVLVSVLSAQGPTDQEPRIQTFALDPGAHQNAGAWLDLSIFHDPGSEEPGYRSLVFNLRASQRWRCRIGNHDTQNTVGLQLRNDDAVDGSLGLWLESETWWGELRTTMRLRGDLIPFEIDSDLEPGNTLGEDPRLRAGYSAELRGDYQLQEWLTLDFGLGASTARFHTSESGYQSEHNGLDLTASAGLSTSWDGFTAGLHLTHFAARSSDLDETARTLDLQLSYELGEQSSITLEVLNLLGSEGSGLDYLYTTRRSGDLPVAEDDIDLGELEPLTLRLLFEIRF